MRYLTALIVASCDEENDFITTCGKISIVSKNKKTLISILPYLFKVIWQAAAQD